MLKSGLNLLFWNSPSTFRVAAAQCKNICPEWLNWPGSLSGISEGAQSISKKIVDHFLPSFVSSKMIISRFEILVHLLKEFQLVCDTRWSWKWIRLIEDQSKILQVVQRSPTPQTSKWSGTIFASSYSKPALVHCKNL